MSTAEDLRRLREAIRTQDVAVCGDAPGWICDFVGEVLDVYLERVDAHHPQKAAEDFYRGACRFVSDTANAEDCKTLLSKIREILRSENDFS